MKQVALGEIFLRGRGMFESIIRKDIEFHTYQQYSNGRSTGALITKPITIFFDKNKISDDEVRSIIDSHRYDISNCKCDDERMIVMPTPMAERLIRNAGQYDMSLYIALHSLENNSLKVS
jgi:hypothetical protein